MLNVLVVDDDLDTATSWTLLLALEGHGASFALDGPSALRQVRDERPDVVLLDLALPGMDGYAVAREVHQLNLWKRPLLVAVSGHGLERDRSRCREAGIDLHLVKPVDPQALLRLLARFRAVVAN